MKSYGFTRLLCMLAFAVSLFTACSSKEGPASLDTFNKLQGYWESIHIKEYDAAVTPEGTKEIYVDRDVDIEQTSTDYYVMRFNSSTVTFIATGDPDDIELLDIPFSYTVSEGNKLGGMVFCGDYAGFSTIKELTDDKLVITLEEHYADEGYDCEFYQEITFRKIY